MQASTFFILKMPSEVLPIVVFAASVKLLLMPFQSLDLPPHQPLPHLTIPTLNPDRHLHLPEGVLAHEVCETVVHAFHDDVRVWHRGVCEQ